MIPPETIMEISFKISVGEVTPQNENWIFISIFLGGHKAKKGANWKSSYLQRIESQNQIRRVLRLSAREVRRFAEQTLLWSQSIASTADVRTSESCWPAADRPGHQTAPHCPKYSILPVNLHTAQFLDKTVQN